MKKIILTIALALGFAAASAQGIKDIRINEILVKNVDSYADDHAHKVGWIELFNSGYSKVNIAAAYLRHIQGTDTTIYRIPKGDVRTLIAPQGYVVFFCNGSSNKGTFHTNFILDQQDSVKLEKLVGINDKIEFLDQSGRTVVDAMEYDVNTQKPDVSFGRILNDDNEIVIDYLHSITPLQNNEVKERTPKSELFKLEDPFGITMAMIAMSAVFCALILLYVIFKNMGKLMQHTARRKKEAQMNAQAEKEGTAKVAAGASSIDEDIDGETVAAIAMALNRHENDMHDIENTVLTINKVAKAYSPWSSKIYSMNQLPNRRK